MCGLDAASTATFHSMVFTTRALRSSSKFSLLRIFQVTVKLSMVVAVAGALGAAQPRLPSVNIC